MKTRLQMVFSGAVNATMLIQNSIKDQAIENLLM